MNGVRSTLMRRGYLLTALSALLLLAASSGTAWAQVEPGSVRFTETTGAVSEGASAVHPTKRPLMVTLERTLKKVNGRDSDSAADDRTFAIDIDSVPGTPGYELTIAGVRGAVVNDGGDGLVFNLNTTEAVLSIIPVPATGDNAEDPASGDRDWDNETFYVSLSHDDAAVEIGPRLAVTVEDDDAQPVVSFSSPSITLTEGSRALIDVSIDKAKGERRPLADLSSAGGSVSIVVDPPSAIEDDSDGNSIIDIKMMGESDLEDLAPNDLLGGAAAGVYTVGSIQDLSPGGDSQKVELTVSANADKADFRNHHITVSFHPRAMTVFTTSPVTPTTPSLGQLMDGGSLSIMTASDESVPTVSFSPTDVSVMEGGSVTSTLLATGEFGADVGMVKLSVEGDAMVGLYRDGEMLEEMDGYVMVDLTDTNAARLTAMSYEDPDLMDGDMAHKTWMIMEADGAEIDGDADWLTVTVEGATAVPALPLIGQLLLALFLMAGGSRLYRRRRG